MKKVLITGGNGFIGRHLCKECEAQGVDYLVTGKSAREDTAHTRTADLLNAQEMEKVIREYMPDAIVHLAAIASPVHNDVAEVYRINVVGTENLLNAAAAVLPAGTSFVLTSTAGVYGNQQEATLHEGLPFNPVNHYSCSKMVTEILSRQYTDRLNIRIVRPFNIIGVGQSENFFIPKLVRRFADRCEEIQLGNLDAVRDYVSVDFCAKVLLDLAVNPETAPGIINVCTGIGHSCRQVIELLEKLTDHHPKIHSTSEFVRSNEVWSMVGDTARLNELVAGRYQTHSLEEILQEMLQRYACAE